VPALQPSAPRPYRRKLLVGRGLRTGERKEQTLMARVDEVADGIYRISTMDPGFSITVNQFLIEDERPTLIHTGMFPMYEDVRKAVAEVLDPRRLSYVVCPHFEADECGGMGRFVAEAPEAVLACSDAGAMLNLTQWDYAGPVQGFRDGEVIDLGEHKLRFLETPHVHHWDSMMVFEETTSSLFPADLYIQGATNRPACERTWARRCAKATARPASSPRRSPC
jgi:flavorubredoxin